MESIYAPRWNWEFCTKYAIRNSNSFFARDMVGRSTISLAQFRATNRCGHRGELVGETRWIQQPSARYKSLGALVEAGYYTTPDIRFALGYSLGEVNDPDFIGSRTPGGPYLDVTFKVDELFRGFGQKKVLPKDED